MAVETGTATDYHDLLDKLRIFLLAEGWTVLNWDAPGSITAPAKLQLQGPGAGAGREVFINIDTVANVDTPSYSWKVRGATGYTADAAEGNNPGEQTLATFFNTWEEDIDYWFYVSDRRFIVVAKCSTSYMSLYAGFFLPFSDPTGYPFPLYVAGDYWKEAVWSHTSSGRRFFADPGGSAANPGGWTRSPTGVWLPTNNHDDAAENDNGRTGDPVQCALWPFNVGEASSGTAHTAWHVSSTGQASGGAMDALVATRQGERALWPLTLLPGNQPPLGVLDGAYAVLGAGLATEQTLTIGARDFTAFQNIQRSSGNDFVAIEEV